MVRAMLAAGARPSATDGAGRTAAQFARECAERGVAYASACADELDASDVGAIAEGAALRLCRAAFPLGIANLRQRGGAVVGAGHRLHRDGPQPWCLA